MNKIFTHFIALISAFIISTILLNIYLKNYYNFNNLKESIESDLKTTQNLQKDLESGKIVIFGSSELTNHTHRFIPKNFLNKELNISIAQNGDAGHQSLAIMSQLASYNFQKVRDNAKVVIFLSPGWFYGKYAKGTNVTNFLKYMPKGMMYKLYFQSDSDDRYKKYIGEYIYLNRFSFNKLPFIYKYAKMYAMGEVNNYNLINKFLINKIKIYIPKNSDLNTKEEVYTYHKIDFNRFKDIAKKLEIAKSKSNEFGINDEYYNKYVKLKITKDKSPYRVPYVPSLNNNQEYMDFLGLLEIFKNYKIKPLFIMQDLNPYVFVSHREDMLPVLKAIKNKLKEYNYNYFDMWSYKKDDYEIGTLTDIMHTGELGWIKIDEKIIEHFILNKEIR